MPKWPDLVGPIRLLRFLRGYEGDVQASAAAFRRMLAWRQEAGMDAIREEIERKGMQLCWSDYPGGAEVGKLLPMVLLAERNSEGHVVQCENTALIDVDGIYELGIEQVMTAMGRSLSSFCRFLKSSCCHSHHHCHC